MHDESKLMQEMLDFDARETERKASLAPSSVFREISEKQALDMFNIASQTVPAYKDFLKRNRVNPEKIINIDDFKHVPLTDKNNYLTKYEVKDLLLGGTFSGKSAITTSSGSSGNPFYWPRTPQQDFGATKGWDSFLVNTFDIDKKTTLHLNCSGMGVWSAGDYISILNKYLSYKYKNNTSVSPGIDLDNTIRFFETISPNFEQTILYSYPPFVKDIIDCLPPKLLKKISLRVVVYGEPYSERWRNYILKKIFADALFYVSSVLGSSEGGLVGIESKNCTLIRKMAFKNKDFCTSMFGKNQIPSLVQYSPQSKYIESVGENIVITSMGGLPLIRYDTHDAGGTITKEDICSIYKRIFNKDFCDEARENGLLVTSLPYLYVFGRNDYTASIYGVLIYPDTIKDILTTNPFNKLFSGKFVMTTKEDDKSNQHLQIILETIRGIDSKDISLALIEEKLADKIRTYSSEYAKLTTAMGKKVYPKIEISNYSEGEHFSSRNKHKYII